MGALFCLREKPLTLAFKSKASKRNGEGASPLRHVQGEKNMGTIPADRSESIETTKAEASPQKHARADKFAEARRAKKKQRRATHRAKLRRSHTNG
jgi:hypothetical protein